MIIILTIVSVCLAIALFGYCVYCHVKNKRTQKSKIIVFAFSFFPVNYIIRERTKL